MTWRRLHSLLCLCSGCLALVLLRPAAAEKPQWIAPTAEELTMKAQAEAPGAPAVYLYREEQADDYAHAFTFYVRLKVLTEGGREHANVELPYLIDDERHSIGNISGRTIHSDGSIVLFTGKPYEKLIEKSGSYKFKAKVFTLPAVEVGSILEYRYTLQYSDDYIEPPEWSVQADLFVRRSHFSYQSTDGTVLGGSVIAWTSRLPKGAEVKLIKGKGFLAKGTRFELDLQNTSPLVEEPFMPPASSMGYSVSFYFTSYATPAEFWSGMGKSWSESCDRFALPGKGVTAFVQQAVTGGDSPEQKLKKLYDAVMGMENTDYHRELTSKEQHAAGLKPAMNSDDVLSQRRGNSTQLTDLFVAMARAAGFKAYVGGVADRRRRLFTQTYLTFSQLEAPIAIVAVGGKEVFFDPGERYCEFGHLAWQHALSGGLRQAEGGTALFKTPGETARAAHVERMAELEVDEQGEASGTVRITSRGDPALNWREKALLGDATSLNADLRTALEAMLPHGTEVRVIEVLNLTDPDKPLVVSYAVKGEIGTITGKRLLLGAHLFQANEVAKFPAAKREMPIMMPYASLYQDTVRVKYPKSMVVEASPPNEQIQWQNRMAYKTDSQKAEGGVTSTRYFVVAQYMIPAEDYTALREFYSQVEAKDQESLVLIRPGAGAASVGATK